MSAWAPKDKYGRNLLDFTQTREKNELVLHLGQLFANEGLHKVNNDEVQTYVEAVVLDFNCRIATKAEFRKWRELLDSICSRGATRNCLSYIMRGLFTQLKTFHDSSEYPDMGEAAERKLTVAGQPFKNKNALKSWIVSAIKDHAKSKMGQPMDQGSLQYKVILEVLKNHPRADEKFKGMIGLSVAQNLKSSNLVLQILRENPEENDDISFGKCLPHLQDPTHDPVRKLICEQIFHFFQYYKSSHAHTLLAAARDVKPPPEYMRSSQGGFQDAQGSNEKIQGYIKGLIMLCELTAPQPAKPRSVPIHTGVSLESLDFTSVHWGLKQILFEYLYAIEMEREGNEKDEVDDGLEELWLNAEVKKLVAIITDRTKKYSAAEKQEAIKLAHNRDGLRALFRQLKTEADVSPVLFKLDEAFSSFLSYLLSEFESKEILMMRNSTFAKHYGAALVNDDTVKDNGSSSDMSYTSDNKKPAKTLHSSSGSSSAFSSASAVPALPAYAAQDLGLLSEASSDAASNTSMRSRQNRDGSDKEVRVVDVFFRLYMPVFRDCCLRSQECRVLPLLFFRLVHCNFPDYHAKLLTEILDATEADSSSESKCRSVQFAVGFCCRAKTINATSLISVMLRLLQPVRQGVLALEKLKIAQGNHSESALALDKQSTLRCAVFSGCLEILACRWQVLHDEAEVDNILKIVFSLAAIDIATDRKLTRECKPIVCKCVSKRLEDFDISVCEPAQDFVTRIKTRGESAQVGEQWPERPFDSIDLHRFYGLVHQPTQWYDWQADISGVLEASEPESKVVMSVENMVVLWEQAELHVDTSSTGSAGQPKLIFEKPIEESSLSSSSTEISPPAGDEEIEKLEIAREDIISAEHKLREDDEIRQEDELREEDEMREQILDPPLDEDIASPAPIEEITADVEEDAKLSPIPFDEVTIKLSPAPYDEMMVKNSPTLYEVVPLPELSLFLGETQTDDAMLDKQSLFDEGTDPGTPEDTPEGRSEGMEDRAADLSPVLDPDRDHQDLNMGDEDVDKKNPTVESHDDSFSHLEEAFRPVEEVPYDAPQVLAEHVSVSAESMSDMDGRQSEVKDELMSESPAPCELEPPAIPEPTYTPLEECQGESPLRVSDKSAPTPTTVGGESPRPVYPSGQSYITIPMPQPFDTEKLIGRFLESQERLVQSLSCQQDRMIGLMATEHQKLVHSMNVSQNKILDVFTQHITAEQARSIDMLTQVSKTNECITQCLSQMTSMMGLLSDRLVNADRLEAPRSPRYLALAPIPTTSDFPSPLLPPAGRKRRTSSDSGSRKRRCQSSNDSREASNRQQDHHPSPQDSMDHIAVHPNQEDSISPQEGDNSRSPPQDHHSQIAQQEHSRSLEAVHVPAPAPVPPPPPPLTKPPSNRRKKRLRDPSPEPLKRPPSTSSRFVEALFKAPSWPDSFPTVSQPMTTSVMNNDRVYGQLVKLEASANA